jgi:hypothetical protein
MLRKANEATPSQLFERSLRLEASDPSNRLATAGNDKLLALFDLFEVLAEAIVELADADLDPVAM